MRCWSDRIQLRAERDGYRLKGVTCLGALFEQDAAANRVDMASPCGTAERCSTGVL